MALVELSSLETGYGRKQVLFGLSLSLHAGEIVALVGPNGSGKSTALKAAYGLLPVWHGDVLFDGQSIRSALPAQNLARGVVFLPQGNRVFEELSVLENLRLGGLQLNRQELGTRLSEAIQMFPVLENRLKSSARDLSGGEQQMVALARAMMSRPRVLMLDEPSLGLAPNITQDLFDRLVHINKLSATTILIVEQKVQTVFEISDRVYGIKFGRVVCEDTPEKLRNEPSRLRDLFL